MNKLNETALLKRCNKMWISQKMAIQIAGGSATLEKLVKDGKVRSNKRDVLKQNGRWDYNLWDVIASCEIRRAANE